VARKKRTQPGAFGKKLSGEVHPFFGAQSFRSFRVWRRSFREYRKGAGDPEFLQVIKAGSKSRTLEQHLFNVLLWYEGSRERRDQTKLFRAKLNSVLSHLPRLTRSLTALVNAPYRYGNCLRACWDLLGSTRRNAGLAAFTPPDSGPGTARYEFL